MSLDNKYNLLVANSQNADEPALAAAAQATLDGEPAMFFIDALIVSLRERSERTLLMAIDADDAGAELLAHSLRSLSQTLSGMATVLELTGDQYAADYDQAVREHTP